MAFVTFLTPVQGDCRKRPQSALPSTRRVRCTNKPALDASPWQAAPLQSVLTLCVCVWILGSGYLCLCVEMLGASADNNGIGFTVPKGQTIRISTIYCSQTLLLRVCVHVYFFFPLSVSHETTRLLDFPFSLFPIFSPISSPLPLHFSH
jgi:hypothetical protein